jgi:hypothetical protein
VSRKRLMWIAVAVVLAGAIGVFAWRTRDDVAYAKIATGYAAKQTCSCLHVSGRPLDSCVAEFPEEARRAITLTEDGDTVRASVLFGAVSATARYEEGYGCSLVN